jgi:hypothetical protein
MTDPLQDWPRPHLVDGGAHPFLFYAVFGAHANDMKLSRSKYRCDAMPEHLDLFAYGPSSHPEVLDDFRSGYLWDELLSDDPVLAAQIKAQSVGVVLKGPVADDSSLNYFRNAIGLLTCLLDAGGVAIYDPFRIKWWSPREWKAKVFEPAAPRPREHVVILVSEEPGGTQWLHTRGLRKFGRPDLSIHDVTADRLDDVVDLFNRFIEFQAYGGVIVEGQEIRSRTLPSGMRCFHGGDEDDPDFNNVHVEIHWP